jgi:hypothetical protein
MLIVKVCFGEKSIRETSLCQGWQPNWLVPLHGITVVGTWKAGLND